MGVDVLLVELEGTSTLVAPLGAPPLDYEIAPVVLDSRLPDPGSGRLLGCKLTPEAALADYLDHSGLSPVSRRLASSGAVEVVAAAAPGIRDLLMLGKIRQLAERDIADLIVVDAPAAGHAITFLQAPTAMAATAASGPVRHQADLAKEMFADERRCQVVLVTLPEETPVNEVVETAYALEDLVDVKLGPVVVNGSWPSIPGLADALAAAPDPDDATAARYRLDRIEAQSAQIERLRSELPLPIVELPYLFTAGLDGPAIGTLADALAAGLEPLAVGGGA